MMVEPIESLRKVVALAEDQPGDPVRPGRRRPARGRLLVASGIRGILNSPRCRSSFPPHVNLVPVDLSVQLENLAYKVQKTQGEVSTSCAG